MPGKADIRERVDAFVSDLENLIRDAIRTRFAEALGDAPAPTRRRPPGSRNEPKAALLATPIAARRVSGKPKSPRGGPPLEAPRSPEALAKLDASLIALIRSKPGQRTEEINAALGTGGARRLARARGCRGRLGRGRGQPPASARPRTDDIWPSSRTERRLLVSHHSLVARQARDVGPGQSRQECLRWRRTAPT